MVAEVARQRSSRGRRLTAEGRVRAALPLWQFSQQPAQATDRLAVQLANARLADFHDGTDLPQIEFLLVVQAQQQALALGHGANGVDQALPQAVLQQLGQRVAGIVVPAAALLVNKGVFLAVAVKVFVIHQLAALDFLQQTLVGG